MSFALGLIVLLAAACDRDSSRATPADYAENPGKYVDASPSPATPDPSGGRGAGDYGSTDDANALPRGETNKDTDRAAVDLTRKGKVASPETKSGPSRQ